MKPVVVRLYAVLVVLTLVGLVAWSAADWYRLQQNAQLQGQAVLRQAAGVVSDLSVHVGVLDAKSLGQVFSRFPGNDFRWKMVLLHSPDQGTEYYRGPRPPLAVDRAVPRWEPRQLSEIKVSLPVFRSTGDPMTLEGIYEFYGRAEIFSLLKACGVTLLILMVLTTAMVVFSARSRNEEEPAMEPVPAEEEIPLDLGDSTPETIGTIPIETEDEYWFDDELTMEDLPPLEEGTSLVNPDSGLGWGSFLAARLDFELEKASSQDQDLALILLSVKGGTMAGKPWGELVRRVFPEVDMNFEYEGGVAVMLPGRTLEQALKSARAFVESADSTLEGAPVHAGVAARTGRLLSAPTLLAEAKSAQRRSLAGAIRVLGLKTDADRWRDHLSASA